MTSPRNSISTATSGLSTWSGRIKFGVGLAVTALLLVLIARRVDIGQMLAAIRGLPGWAIGSAALLLVLDFAAKIARWRAMLAPAVPGIGWPAAAKTLLASIALNNVLPLRAGDAARAFAFNQSLQASAQTLVPLMLLERLLDTAMLLVLATLGLTWLHVGGQLTTGFAMLPVIAGLLALCLIVGVLAVRPIARCANSFNPRLLDWLPSAIRSVLSAALSTMTDQLHGRQLATLVSLTALAWLCESGLFCVLAAGLNLPQAGPAGVLGCAAATLSGLVPSAPGAFGTFHASAMLVAGSLGAGADQAAAFAVVTHAVMWLPLTLAGVACLAAVGTPNTPQPQPLKERA